MIAICRDNFNFHSFDFEDEKIIVRLPRKNKNEAWNAPKQAIDILLNIPKKIIWNQINHQENKKMCHPKVNISFYRLIS